jgi:hypothetical protein
VGLLGIPPLAAALIGLNALLVGALMAVGQTFVAWPALIPFALSIVMVHIYFIGLAMPRKEVPPLDLGETLAGRLRRQASGTRKNVLYDEETGLFHRWYLELRLEEETRRCRRYNLSMSLIVVRFEVELAALSTGEWQASASERAVLAAQSVRSVDLASVVGPGEFAICLVHCDRAGAEAVVNRLATRLGQWDFRIGVAVFPDDNCEGNALIELARVRSGMVEELQAA